MRLGGRDTGAPILVATLLFVGIVAALAPPARGADEDTVPFSDKFPVMIDIPEHAAVYELAGLGIDIDAVGDRWIRAYVNESEVRLVELLGYSVRRIPNQALRMARMPEGKRGIEDYHTYDELTTALQQVATDHASITELVSIGQSVNGDELWFLKISDNPGVEENEPEFKYISTMHGDEPVGTENCLKFIDWLTDNYDSGSPDPRLQRLVDEIEIWIMPMMNPDGNTAGSRYNANGVDLNRHFPDWVTDPTNTPDGREPEIQAVMIFSDSMSFDLSANFHTGALVVNYPHDNRAPLAPDNDLYVAMSEAYSSRNLPMWNSPSFYHGITNGYAWYEIHGGMQDWNYDFMRDMEVTIELCNTKWPDDSQLPQLWDDNDSSMVAYMEYCLQGVRGVVTDASSGDPLAVTVSVTEIGWDDWTDADVGDYHRILEPGTYTFGFSSPGYQSQQFSNVMVVGDSATVLDVQLVSIAPAVVSGIVTSSDKGPLVAKVEAYYQDGGDLADSTTTDPADGSYSLSLLKTDYDIKAWASGYAPEHEFVSITGDTTIDFVLDPVSGSILVVDDGSSKRSVSKESLEQIIFKGVSGAAADMADDLVLLGYEVVEESAATTDPGTWEDHELLVWSCGTNSAPVGTESWRRSLLDYVAAGGVLLIEGGEVAYDAASSPAYPNFADSVLHTDGWDGDEAGHLSLDAGQTGHPIVTEPNPLPGTIQITYSGWYSEDAAHPAPDAYVIYGTSSYPSDAGVLVYDRPGRDGTGQIVFLPFCYSDLSDRGTARDLLQNSVAYLIPQTSSITEDGRVVLSSAIESIRPNPFNPATTISFSVPSSQSVRLAIYDIYGRNLAVLVDGEVSAGTHHIAWDGRDARGRQVASGVYFCRLRTADAAYARKMVKLN